MNKPVLNAFTLLRTGSQEQAMVQNCLAEAKTKVKLNEEANELTKDESPKPSLSKNPCENKKRKWKGEEHSKQRKRRNH